MNERIQQLATEAELELTIETKKFAELIIQECAGKVDFILREKSNGGGTMGDEMREHFGVEA
jgi:hypothetical protein